MAYRYTNTDKWDDAWFVNLKPSEKLLFNYLCDNCDIAGFMEINIKRWAVEIGYEKKIIEGALKGLQRGLIYSETGECIYLRNFLRHQKNWPLNEKNMAHLGILKRFDLYSHKFKINGSIIEFIEGGSMGLGSPYGIGNGNGKDIGNGKRAEFDFLFLDETWKELFLEWIEYKKSIKDSYTTQKTIEACYRNLQLLSRNDLNTARRIIDQSIGNKWKGLFPLKEAPKQKDELQVSTKYIKHESN